MKLKHLRGDVGLTLTLVAIISVFAASSQVNIAVTPGQGAISINFAGGVTAMGAAEIAGVVPRSNWNNAGGASRATPLALVDETGTATTATVAWTSNHTWSTPITDQAGNRRLMKGYLDTTNVQATSITVAGLASGGYDLYVYADGDNPAARTAVYQMTGPGIPTASRTLIDSANTNFNTTFTEANNSIGNYVRFSFSGTGFTLTATPGSSSDAYMRAPLNGLQIVPTTPPAPDFTLGVTPASRTVPAGASASTSYTVSVGALDAFGGAVSFAVSGLPAGASASFSPTTVTGTGSTTLTVTTTAATPAGSPTVTITATSGSLSHTATVGLMVTGPAGTISIDFVGTGTAMSSSEVAGVVAKGYWNNATGASRTSPLPVVDEWGAATTATATWSANTTGSTGITDAAGNNRLMKGYLYTDNTTPATVTVGGLLAGTYDVYVYTDGNNGNATRTAAYQMSGTGITTTAINLTDSANTNFSGSFVQANNSSGNYVKFRITGGGFTLTATPGASSNSTRRAQVNGLQIVPVGADFTVSAAPASRTVTPGDVASYTVNVAALGGFVGSVDLGVSGLPSNVGAIFTPALLTGSGSATLTVTTQVNTPAGSYTPTITGTAGALVHTTSVMLVVSAPTFSISGVISPSTVGAGATVNLGGTGTASTTATGSGNYTFAGLAGGPYLVTPNKAGYTFTPTSRNVTVSGTDVSGVDFTALPSGLTAISVDFVGQGTAMAPQETAGVVAKAFWNSATGASSDSPLALVDETGSPTTASITWVSDGGWSAPIQDQAGNARMMRGYLDTGSLHPTTVTVAGLAAGLYDLYVYVDGDNASASRTGGYQLSGPGVTTTSINATDQSGANFAGAFTPASSSAGNYVRFSGFAASGFTLTATPGQSSDVYPRAPVNGIQIVPASTAMDFTVTATPGSQTVIRGGTTSYTVNAGSLNGFTGIVNFSVSGLPTGTSGSFSPLSVTGAGISTLTLTTTASTPLASSTLTITGTSGALSHTTAVTLTVTTASGVPLTINGAQTFQRIDGFGVNANSLSWKNGELRPALDMLVDQMGATAFRVIFDMEDWEDTNDNNDPSVPNWTYYNSLYASAKFQNLWGTLHYLNQKGITSGITLSFMGRVPTWMGGSVINANREDEWVEMIATVLAYARNTELVQFNLVDPLNETDNDGIEGPLVNADQYTALLAKLSQKLDAMGLSDFRFVGPNTANITAGLGDYISHMMGSAVVMSKVDHFGLHDYSGSSGGADAVIKSSAYPARNFWMTEIGTATDALTLIGQNASGIQVWEGYDSVYNHAILAGRGTTAPNDDCCGTTGSLAYNGTTGLYTPRPIFYQLAQIFRFVPAGSVRVAATESNTNLTVFAFSHQPTGRVTLVGRNTGASAIAVTGSLSGLPAVSSFQFYQTDSTNNFLRGSDVTVSSGVFSFVAPANSYFTLTAIPGP